MSNARAILCSAEVGNPLYTIGVQVISPVGAIDMQHGRRVQLPCTPIQHWIQVLPRTNVVDRRP